MKIKKLVVATITALALVSCGGGGNEMSTSKFVELGEDSITINTSLGLEYNFKNGTSYGYEYTEMKYKFENNVFYLTFYSDNLADEESAVFHKMCFINPAVVNITRK